MEVTVNGLTVERGGRRVLQDVNFTVRDTDIVGLLGPNGAGKSTLLATLAGLLTPTAGTVLMDGASVHDMRRRQVAQRVALMEQHADRDIPLRALDVVELGLLPHHSRLGRGGGASHTAQARRALASAGAAHLEDRDWSTLSGGERQRVSVARAFAQRPQLLLLDEPTNHLDVKAQLDTLGILAQRGMTVVTALHDLNHAARFCSHVVVLSEGHVAAQGAPHDVLTAATIKEVFDVDATVLTHPADGRPVIAFDGTSDAL